MKKWAVTNEKARQKNFAQLPKDFAPEPNTRVYLSVQVNLKELKDNSCQFMHD